jgi:transcriptional regulator with XRE-family HTH domain
MKISKSAMAKRMGTSRAQVDRLLDPKNPSVDVADLDHAAHAVGVSASGFDAGLAGATDRRGDGLERRSARPLDAGPHGVLGGGPFKAERGRP